MHVYMRMKMGAGNCASCRKHALLCPHLVPYLNVYWQLVVVLQL
jgi:hypothetical protein